MDPYTSLRKIYISTPKEEIFYCMLYVEKTEHTYATWKKIELIRIWKGASDVPPQGSPGPTTRPQNSRTESSPQIYQYQPAMELPNIPFSKSEYIETVSYVCSTLTKITSIIFLQKLLGKKNLNTFLV